MDNPDRLTAALRMLADDESALGASAAVEARLLEELRSIANARRRRRSAMALATAAALLLALAATVWRRPGSRTIAEPATGAADGIAGVQETVTEFFPLRYSSVPISEGQLVRLVVPRSALASFGLAPVDSQGMSWEGTVLADVLVGEDGLARAVRFVHTTGGSKESSP
jgi:hypothetical protein